MEENIAIMMADLSGYTALTETHGPSSAADLIDKYMEIVETCLVGDSKFVERTGDEVMIVSHSADQLLASAVLLINAISKEENFLEIHGGLHFGKVLKRKNSFFGTSINLTSRIAAKASAGCFWCSEEFTNALSGTALVKLEPKGKHSLKNISEQQEMFEVVIENKKSFFIDPICRMLILNTEKAIKHPVKEDIFFCSPSCLDIHHKKRID